MASNGDSGGGSNGTISRNFPTREYDSLKLQIEKTNNELNTSRRRCDHALSDLDYYREQHRAVMNQLEVSSQDSASLRTRYAELLGEHKQLQAEHRRLGQQQQQQAAARGDGDALLASHAHALAQLEAARSDSARLAEQCEALGLERGQAQRDVAGLKQQLVKLFKDNAKFREAHQKLQQQYEEAVNCTIKANKEIKRLTDERNATTAEYTLIMSERDTVHKEMEKLSDDLAQSMKKMKLLNAGNQELQEEKRNFTYQLESLRREITSALHERDKALRECAELREKFGELGGSPHGGRPALGDAQARKSRGGRHADGASGGEGGEGGEGGSERSRDDARGAGGQRRRPDTLDQANQELEALRKSLDKANAELAAASQEAEVSKRRRDWAFGERDKIVQERESIRTLCDNMRKERDRAVSELAESLRESDAVKRQRNELLKEAKTLREALDAQCDDDGGAAMPAGCDRQPPHEFAARAARTEVVELELTASDEAGLEFGGGRDFSGNGYVFVSAVAPGSTAEGKLHPNDYILRVNDVDCSQGSLRMVTEAIRSSMPLARVLVRRHGGGAKPPRAGAGGEAKAADHVTKWIHTARLAPGGHGLALKMGVYVHRIGEGGTAARDKTLTVGDRVLRINDKSMDDIETSHDAMQVLNDESADVINITTLKMSYPECPNVFTPVRRHKKENRSSQTDDWLAGHQQQEFKYGQEKNNGGAWLKEKLDMMRGPWRHSKEDKKKYRNSSPNPIDFGHEQAIAELDLVLESYHHGTVKRQGGAAKRHFSQTKDEKNNGGTWPKARAAPLLTSSGGTVATRARERPPLSLLAPPPDGGYSHHRNSTPAPLAAALAAATPMAVGCARHAACKSADATRGFGAPPGDSLERLGAGVHSDHSLDFPVHRFVDKEVIAYYKKNSRSGATRYGSDSERDSLAGVAHLDAAGGGAQPHSRGHSQPFVAAPRAHHPFHALALAAPPPAIDRSRDSFSFEPIHHAHSPSADVATAAARRQPEPPEAGGTFPRKNQRFRVPSNPSVTSKLSTGSIERGGSERGSPMPIFHVEVLSSPGDHSGGGVGGGAAGASKDHCPWGHKPVPGELRRVHIDKSNEPLGIQINCPDAGGIFVSTVNENSLASRVGLQIGDQLLEVCGINMRNATYNLAANVLRQCGNSITMLVQYSPDKYHELQGGVGSCSGSTSESEEEDEEEADGEATPCNSPKEVRKSSSSQMKPSQLMVMQRQAHNVSVSGSSRSTSEEPRYLCIETLNTSNLGISLVGGNAAGVFIHSVQPDSLAYHAGLRTGDQILEYNGTDLRAATAEEAAYELAKPADKVAVLAHYRIDKYNEIKDKPGDSLYVRCGFDRGGNDMTEPPQLSFAKDEVVYVDNTMFNGVPGQWRAWKLDGEGHRQQCGVIPSKYKVEEELLLRRGGAGDPEGRSTATARRSFFRRKKHQRGSSGSSGLGTSRDSKELASFCNLSPGWYSDSGSLHEDLSQSSYQRVERLQHPEFRPVIVLGPLAECVADKLVQDFPDKFNRASTESRRCSQAQLDRELAEGLILEYRRRGSCYECITVAAVRAVAQTRLHCMLDGSVTMAERLRRHHVHPVVLLVKFKSTKQIREVKDARYSIDKVSGKAAKEMFEHGRKLEAEYRHLVTAVVAAGANVAHICAQVKAAVDAEHGKSQWVPTATLH